MVLHLCDIFPQDGGGFRGDSSLLILQRVMFILDGRTDPEVPRPLLPIKYFDLICGSSTGGLMAIMLEVLEMDVETCLVAYKDMAPQILPDEFISSSKV